MSSVESEWRNYLLRNNIIEGQHEAKKRDHIFTILRSLLQSFIQLSIKENNTRSSNFECQLLPFGSFALGGHLLNGDIDVVLLAPGPVRRRDFFRFFTKLLKSQPMIREVDTIPRAKVPIIKCVIDSIPIDISFVRLHVPTVPRDIDLLNDSILRGLENCCFASTDGPRVGQFIARHIHTIDIHAFRLAMQCIKHWANQRDIYGKPMGYLNGGSWTLLLLKTYLILRSQSSFSSSPRTSSASEKHTQIPQAQQTGSPSRHRSASPAPDTPTPTKATPVSQPVPFISLLKLFFRMWSTWSWPKPVILTQAVPIDIGKVIIDMNSINNLDCIRTSLLPICTPCHPVTSAAPFVTQSTLDVVKNELTRAHQILQSDLSAQLTMEKLFKPLHIIKSYKHFIKITVSCETSGSHDIWSRRTPSSIPRLVELLESIEEIKVARPFTKSYTDFVAYHTRHQKDLLKSGVNVEHADAHGKKFPGSLYRRFFLIGLDFHDRYKNANSVVDLLEVVQAFYREIDDKKNSNDSDVNIHISSIKRRMVTDLIERMA